MMCFTALRLDTLQLPVCLKLLLWIDGFTLLVFILGAKSACDLIYVAHAGQWPVSRPEAALCHLFHCVISGLQWMGLFEICDQKTLLWARFVVKPWGTFNRLARNEQSDHVPCFRNTPKTCCNRQTQCLRWLFGPWTHLWISLGLAMFRVCETHCMQSACFLHSANLILWIWQRLVTGTSPGWGCVRSTWRALVLFPEWIKVCWVAFWALLTHIISEYKAFSFVSSSTSLWIH